MVLGLAFIGFFAAVVTPAVVVLMIPLSFLETLGCAFLGANVTVLGFIGAVLLRDFSAQLAQRGRGLPAPLGGKAAGEIRQFVDPKL
jgi:hypothetical protein